MAHALALLGTAALVPVVLVWLRRAGHLDHPGSRSLHEVPTPRGGGLAPVVCFVLAVIVWGGYDRRPLVVVVGVVVGLAGVGLADDLGSVPATRRLVAQGLAGVVGAVGLWSGVGVLVGLAAAVWIVGYVNAFNFMDGVNGLAAGQAMVAGASFALAGHRLGMPEVEIPGALLALAAVGFLPYNFPRARVFLGDVGSYGLGAAIALLAVYDHAVGVPVLVLAGPVALFVGDTGVTVVRRAWRRESLLEAHREHAFQRLAGAGWSHLRITLVVVGLMVASAAAGALALNGASTVALLGVATIVVAYLSLPTAVARVARRRSPPG